MPIKGFVIYCCSGNRFGLTINIEHQSNGRFIGTKEEMLGLINKLDTKELANITFAPGVKDKLYPKPQNPV